MPGPALLPHQREGIRFLLERRNGILAFEQGLGKTAVALAAFGEVRAKGEAETLVVVCPNSLKRTWAGEIERFAPGLSYVFLEGTAQQRRELLMRSRVPVVLASYETARNEVTALRAFVERWRAVLVLDESHTVKNLLSQTRRAMGHVAPLVRYRWLLSGTPLTNSPSDLYSQISLVEPEHGFGPLDAFQARFGDARDDAAKREALGRAVAPFLLRRTKEQCLDLPSKTYVDVLVELPSWQRNLYNSWRDGLVRDVRAMSPSDYSRAQTTIFERLLRLAQIASNPELVDPFERREHGKAPVLRGLVEDLTEGVGRKVVVWSHFVPSILRMQSTLSAFGPLLLYGGVPVEARQDVTRRFQEDGRSKVLLANPAVGGVGFTLTAASHAIYESMTWQYGLYAQSQDRIHRIGQVMPVTYTHLIAKDTIEEAMLEALRRKARLASAAVGDGGEVPPVARLTPEALCEMLTSNRLPV